MSVRLSSRAMPNALVRVGLVAVLLLGSVSLAACGPAEEGDSVQSAATVDEATASASSCRALGACATNRQQCCSSTIKRNNSCSSTFSCCAPSNTWVRVVSQCCSGKSIRADGHNNALCR